jgi:DHA1 family tetracycline resistance protein-like MFS transporter
VLLDVLALGIIIPVFPRLVAEFLGRDRALGAEVYGLIATIWATMQFFCAPLLGVISDRFGRRAMLVASTLGLAADYGTMALAPSLGWILAGRVLSGATFSGFATGFAYVADITPADRRAARFGLLGAAIGIGFVVGPATGGILGHIDLRLPFAVAAGLSVAGALYAWLVLPESLPRDQRTAIAWRRANPVGALDLLMSREALLGLAIAAFVYRLAHDSLTNLFVIFTDYRFGWDHRQVGYVLALFGVSLMIVQGGLVGPATRRYGERAVMLLGLAFGIVGMLVFGLAPSGAWFIAGIPFGALFGLAYPAMQGLMTRRVHADEQGRLQGALAGLMGIAGVVAPVLFTQSFSLAIGPYRDAGLPGFPFLLAALILVIAMAVGARATPRHPHGMPG